MGQRAQGLSDPLQQPENLLPRVSLSPAAMTSCLKLSPSVVLMLIRLLLQTLRYIPSPELLSSLSFLPALISQGGSVLFLSPVMAFLDGHVRSPGFNTSAGRRAPNLPGASARFPAPTNRGFPVCCSAAHAHSECSSFHKCLLNKQTSLLITCPVSTSIPKASRPPPWDVLKK